MPTGWSRFWQALPKARYPEVAQQIQFFDKILPKLAALRVSRMPEWFRRWPFSGSERGMTFTIVGQPAPAQGMEPSASHLTTNENYFRAMRIPLKSGRTFEARDSQDSAPVMMINQAFAEKYFAHQNPLWQRINIGDGMARGKPPRQIIGVVGTAKHGNLAEPESPEFYIPFAQDPITTWTSSCGTSEPAPSGLEAMIRRAVHEVDSQQFVPTIKPLAKLISQTLSQFTLQHGAARRFRRCCHSSRGGRHLRRDRIQRRAADERNRHFGWR